MSDDVNNKNKDCSFKKLDRVKTREMLYKDMEEVLRFGYPVGMDQYDKMRVLRLIQHKVREGKL